VAAAVSVATPPSRRWKRPAATRSPGANRSTGRRQVVERLLELRRRGTTILLVEQNTRAALRVATRGYLLRRGAVLLEGTSEELREAPGVEAAYLGHRALGGSGA
jgi:ABC-type branched-subunit amino acid transport system ATPase component